MSNETLDFCADEHTPTGTIGWPVPYMPGDLRAHASIQVCDRTQCQEAASRWVHDCTGHDGIYHPFASARSDDTGRVVLAPERVACMTCDRRIERGRAKVNGWLVDQYPTPSGSPIQVVICFPCRQKADTAEAAEQKPCEGSCEGDYDQPDGWKAICTWFYCDKTWACWDEGCVREWAEEHGEPGECDQCGQLTDHSVTVKQISEWLAKAGAQ